MDPRSRLDRHVEGLDPVLSRAWPPCRQLRHYTEPSRRYEDDLADSAFSDVSQHLFRFPRVWTPQQVIGYLRTTSFARADLFAERHAEFEADALHMLEGHADENGWLTEQVDFTVLLARRPGGTA